MISSVYYFLDLLASLCLYDFIHSAKARFEELDVRFHEMRTAYDHVVQLYGEDPKIMSPHEFFGIFHTFIRSFKASTR